MDKYQQAIDNKITTTNQRLEVLFSRFEDQT
jgi:hypothetical protein